MQTKSTKSIKTSSNLILLRQMIDMYMTTNSLKQYQLGKKIGFSTSVISRWMKNDEITPQDGTIKKVATKLGYVIRKENDGEWSLVDESEQVAKLLVDSTSSPTIRSSIEELQQIASELTDKDLQIRMLQALNSLSNERAKLYEEISSIKTQLIKMK